MNILAEEQKKIFQPNLSPAEYQKIEEEFLDLYFKLRKENENKFYSKLSLEQRQNLHKYIYAIYTVKNRLGGFTHEIIKDQRVKTNRPTVFVVTHVGKFDIEIVSQAIKDHYYLLSGDFEHLQGIIDEPFLGMNGVFYFNEFDKEDRKAVTQKMIYHLKQNGNIMYFIEGTWNLSPNLPVLPCYWGIVDIVKVTNAIIVPIAADQYGKHFKINIGQNFDMNLYGIGDNEKSRAITDLRDVLASLKWEIWETEKTSRININSEEWNQYVENRFSEWPYFNRDYINRLIYKPQDVIEKKDVYAFTKKLVPSKSNAFIYNKRLKDDIFA